MIDFFVALFLVEHSLLKVLTQKSDRATLIGCEIIWNHWKKKKNNLKAIRSKLENAF